MAIRFVDRRTNKMKTSSLVAVAAASLLLISAPGVMRAQAPAPGFPPPGFGRFMQQAEPGAGWLGVSISEVTADKAKEMKLSEARGVAIDEVGENSPAAKPASRRATSSPNSTARASRACWNLSASCAKPRLAEPQNSPSGATARANPSPS